MTKQQQFQPSHRITLVSGEVEEVMLVDGAAYTRAEWESESAADYERDDSGPWPIWKFQGEPIIAIIDEIA